MSDMYITPIIDEIKMVEDAKHKSRTDRIMNPEGRGVTVHYHPADTWCMDRRHRMFLDGDEVEIHG
jgi:hypothetical protein